MRLHRLTSVDGFIAFDFDDTPASAGGTRLAPDVDEREVALLARAMTYKFGVLEAPLGGAKAGIRTAVPERDEVLARYCEEIRPLVESGRFLTGPDLGTSEHDFAPLRDADAVGGAITSTVDGVAFEDLLTGYGVAVAAETALGSLDGRTVALEGFGKVGGGAARELAHRGGRVVALSTMAGCVHDSNGLDVERLWGERAIHGDAFVAHLGLPVLPTAALFDAPADVLVPGARTGVLHAERAAQVAVRHVVPAANVPYTAEGLQVLQDRGIAAHADFICNAGAIIGYRSPRSATPDEVLAAVGARVAVLVAEAADHPHGPFARACAMAERYIAGWRGPDGLPDGPPLA